MTKKNKEQESLFGNMYTVYGVVQRLDGIQVRQLESVGHRVLPLNETKDKGVLAESLSGGRVVLVTRKA